MSHEWGGTENDTMRGYVLYALREIARNEPDLQLSDEQRKALFRGLRLATSDHTAQEAREYYYNN